MAQTVAGYEHNKVRNTTAPEIDSSEIELPRKARTFVAQLRSGYCAWLNSYKHWLSPAVHNSCPDCNATPHSVTYLFECLMHQNNMTPVDLWLQPRWLLKKYHEHLSLWIDSWVKTFDKLISYVNSATIAAFFGTAVHQVSLRWTISNHRRVEVDRTPHLGSSTCLVFFWCVSLSWSIDPSCRSPWCCPSLWRGWLLCVMPMLIARC